MREKLTGAIKLLAVALEAKQVDKDDGQRRLRGESGATIRLSPAIQPRALLLLDGLAKALAVRGHEVCFTEPPERHRPCTLSVHLSGVELHLHLVEPLVKAQHQRTPKEAARFKNYAFIWRGRSS